MRIYKLNGQRVYTNKELVVGQVRYPAEKWSELGEEKLSELGVTWEDVSELPKPNGRWYKGRDDNGDPIPKALEDILKTDDRGEEHLVKGVKTVEIEKIKQQVNSLLQSTDWMSTRHATRNVPIPVEVRAYRDAVVESGEQKEAAILTCASIDELIALFTSTEESPSIITMWPTEDDDFSSWVPKTITKLQAVEQLDLDGKLNDFTLLLSSDPARQLRWDAASVLDRYDASLIAAAPALGIDLDTFFKTAVKL